MGVVTMARVFHKTSRGYRHDKEKMPCQDYSAGYSDPNVSAITCCDGHGGAVYIRSEKGSRFASNALIRTFLNLSKLRLNCGDNKEFLRQIRLQILCDYNREVEIDLKNHPIRKRELSRLSEDEKDRLRSSSSKAYGTTLSGAALYGDKLVVVSIGDTEVLGIRDGEIVKVFDTDDDPAGNVTYSMCQEDAFDYLRVKIVDFRKLDGIFLATDGFTSPYQSYGNLVSSGLKPIVFKAMQTGNEEYAATLVDALAARLGTGDDVSLAFILKDNVRTKNYR